MYIIIVHRLSDIQCPSHSIHEERSVTTAIRQQQKLLKIRKQTYMWIQNEATVIVNDHTFSTPHNSRIDDMSDRNHGP